MEDSKQMYQIAIWLVKTLCLDTNATQATYTLTGFHNKDGEQLGDWEIVIRKKESK